MRFEGLIWFVIGGFTLLLSLDMLIRNIIDTPELIPIWSYLLGFAAFFSMGIGLLMMINEITKSGAPSEK